MEQDGLTALAAIRERLNALQARLSQHEQDTRERQKELESDLRELAKTVAHLSQTVATLVARMPAQATAGAAIAAGTGISGAVATIVTYILTQYLPR
jgi:chromosome segregation ATPase